MRSIGTLLMLGIFSSLTIFSQVTTSINELLERLDENHIGAVTDVFTPEEIQTLRTYLDSQSTVPPADSKLGVRKYTTIENVSNSVATIDPEDIQQIDNLGISDIPGFEGAGVVLQNGQEAMIISGANNVFLRDIGQNTAVLIGSVNLPPPQQLTGLELSSAGEMYGLSTDGAGVTSFLHINSETLEVTTIGPPTGQVVGINLGRDSSDNFYSVDIDTDLMTRINMNTGAATTLGPIGFDANFGQGMTWDGLADKMYLMAFNGSTFDSEFREVNTTTGFTLNLGTIVPGTTMQFGWASFYDETLDIADLKLVPLHLYPNPVEDELRIASDTPLEMIRVFNVLGDMVFEKRLSFNRAIIDMSGLNSGMYIVHLTTVENSMTRKIVKK